MKITLELEIGPETAFVVSALEEQVKSMETAVAIHEVTRHKEQAQVFVDLGKRLNKRLEETIQKAIPFDFKA